VPAPTDLAGLDAEIVACRRCPRLVAWREEVAVVKRASYAGEDYWGRPVPGFGAPAPLIWIVGLAPAAHGANRTGRMFTGDRSGDWLFASLHRCGLAAQPTSVSRDDGQRLEHVRITAAVHCAPPDNKPTTEEKAACAQWLDLEVGLVEPTVRVVVALGGIAWTVTQRVLRAAGWEVERVPFGHEAQGTARTTSGRAVTLLASYHPSQQNTFTGRLTEEMLDNVMATAGATAGLPRPVAPYR
jgi:uracil-DNA glycosylase family 4